MEFSRNRNFISIKYQRLENTANYNAVNLLRKKLAKLRRSE